MLVRRLRGDRIAGRGGALTGYTRPGKGQLLIITDSFGDEIAPNFIQEFAEVWLVHTTISKAMPLAPRLALSRWLHQRFQNACVLLVTHNMGTTGNFDSLVFDVLEPK